MSLFTPLLLLFGVSMLVTDTKADLWTTLPPEYPDNEPCFDTTLDGTQGWCEHTDCCEYDYYVSDACPHYPEQVKCCYSRNACSVTEGCAVEDACLDEVQSLACEILDMYEQNQIWLKPEHFDDRGNEPEYDGASSLSNIRDSCLGLYAKRSAYENAPGGCTCLHTEMLRTMRDYAEQFYSFYQLPIEINAIAGKFEI